MGRTVPTVRQLLNEEYQEWIKMKVMLPPEERKALKELLDAALTRSDAGSIVPKAIPSETLFMLMLIHLKARVDALEERLTGGDPLNSCTDERMHEIYRKPK